MCNEKNKEHGCCGGDHMHAPRFSGPSCHCGGFGRHFVVPAILLLLEKEPSHGYSLLKTLSDMGLVEEETNPMMVYRVLGKLEEDGLATHEHIDEGQGPTRKVFRLTDEGKKALSAWNDRLGEHAAFIEWFKNCYTDLSEKES